MSGMAIKNPFKGKAHAGPSGPSGTLSVGSTTTLSAGSPATVTNTGTPEAGVLNFGIPRGADGDNGAAATISVGTTTTGAPGSSATVTNSGSSSAATLNFTIPRGADGTNGYNGSPGAAATISLGTVATGSPGSSASITNSGTSAAAVFNFTIPRGDQGPAGPSKRIVTLSGVTDASGNVSFTFSPAFPATPHVSVMLQAGNTRQFSRITAASATGCTVNAFQQNQTLLSLLGLDILTAGVTAISGATVRIMAAEM